MPLKIWKETKMKTTLPSVIRKVERLVSDNSPAILTAIGVTGVVGTAYLTGKATVKATRILDEEKARATYKIDFKFTKKEQLEKIWKLYIPPVISGVLTISAVVCAARIGSRRTAAMASAVVLSERAFDEYKSKVVETIGKKKEQEVRDEVAKDRVHRDLGDKTYVIHTEGKILCHDAYSGRFFESTINDIEAAVNNINRNIMQEDSQSVSDFYDMIGLEHTSLSDEMGWNNAEQLTLDWTTVPGPTPTSPAAHSFDFGSRPILRPYRAVNFR